MAKKKRTSASRRAAPANRQQGRDTDQHRRALRNQRIVLGFAIPVLALFVISMGLVLTGTDSAAPPEGSPTSTSSTTSVPEPGGGPPPTAAGPPIEVPSIPAGERLDGPTPCPAPDGSSPRVTSFAEPPPRCIDADRNYNVTVTTSVGDLDFLMSAPQGPDAVNNFVVLARYHYYDGLPLVSINPTKEFTVVPSFDGEPAPATRCPPRRARRS